MFRNSDLSSLPLGVTERRVLWIISLYRGAYTLALLGSVLLPNFGRTSQSTLSLPFTVCAMLYFCFAMMMIVMALREERVMPLTGQLWVALLGDTGFIGLLMIAGNSPFLPLPVFIFPQLAAHGWLLERRIAWAHAAVPTLVFLTVSFPLYFSERYDLNALAEIALICASYFFIVRIAMDIGHYTKASERLARQRSIDIINLEQINRTVIRDMKDGVIIVDLNGIVRGYNPQAPRLLDVSDRGVAGAPLKHWNAGLDEVLQHWREAPDDMISPLLVGNNELPLLPRFVRIGSGSTGANLIYLEDLGQARQEAQNLKLAALGRLTASIAHEIRNPLSAIQHAAQLLEEDDTLSPENARLLTMIRNNGKRIDRIVSEVLQLNRRDRRNPESILLSEVLRGTIEELMSSEHIPEDVIVVQIDPALEKTRVAFDRGQLDQIIWNLLRNAWQFCKKEKGSIAVNLLCGKDPEHLHLDISDDGPGIAAETRDRLFEPFFTTRASGTGLGLYIARELAFANLSDLALLTDTQHSGAHFRLRMKIQKEKPRKAKK
jgi:two-component system sensor histidine kinase PilS (NtrC family)